MYGPPAIPGLKSIQGPMIQLRGTNVVVFGIELAVKARVWPGEKPTHPLEPT